jgi:hypothetical protein
MDKLRKNAVLASLAFLIIDLILVLSYDSGSNNAMVKRAIEPFVFRVFGELSDIHSVLFGILLLGATIGFYFTAWRNSYKAIWFYLITLGFALLWFILEWGLEVNMGISNFLWSLQSIADGVILCCLLISKYEIKK